MDGAKRVQKAPDLDAAGMVKGGTPAAQHFPDWKQWVEGSSEFDGFGKSVADTINGNAAFLNDVNARLLGHVGMDDARQTLTNQRLKALEDAIANSPFPA